MTPFKRTARMVGIVGGPAVEHMHNFVGPIIPIRVFQEQQTRLIHNENATIPKFETGRAMQLIVKYFAGIRFAVAICILQN